MDYLISTLGSSFFSHLFYCSFRVNKVLMKDIQLIVPENFFDPLGNEQVKKSESFICLKHSEVHPRLGAQRGKIYQFL